MTDFDHILVQIGNSSFKISATTLYWIAICLILSIILIIVGRKFKHADYHHSTKGIIFVFELYATTLINMAKGNLGKNALNYISFFGTIFMAMLPANLIGLLGLQPPTSNLGNNLIIAGMFFLLIQYTGIKRKGFGRLKEMFEPFFLLFPLNVIGEITLPFSMSLRLFGNILSGSIIMGLLYSLMMYLGIFGLVFYVVTPFLHVYFDVFSGVIQTYVFFMLGTFFLQQQLEEE